MKYSYTDSVTVKIVYQIGVSYLPPLPAVDSQDTNSQCSKGHCFIFGRVFQCLQMTNTSEKVYSKVMSEYLTDAARNKWFGS